MTTIEIIHTANFYYDSWSQLSFVTWIESYSISMLSKVLEFRSNIFYIDFYEKTQNIPGIVQICIKFLWEGLWFDNLYYGTNLVLKQSTEKKSDDPFYSPIVSQSNPRF